MVLENQVASTGLRRPNRWRKRHTSLILAASSPRTGTQSEMLPAASARSLLRYNDFVQSGNHPPSPRRVNFGHDRTAHGDLCMQNLEDDRSHPQKLDVFHLRCLRSVLRITYHDHITNVEVHSLQPSPNAIFVSPDTFYASSTTGYPRRPAQGKRKQGRPKITW